MPPNIRGDLGQAVADEELRVVVCRAQTELDDYFDDNEGPPPLITTIKSEQLFVVNSEP